MEVAIWTSFFILAFAAWTYALYRLNKWLDDKWSSRTLGKK